MRCKLTRNIADPHSMRMSHMPSLLMFWVLLSFLTALPRVGPSSNLQQCQCITFSCNIAFAQLFQKWCFPTICSKFMAHTQL